MQKNHWSARSYGNQTRICSSTASSCELDMDRNWTCNPSITTVWLESKALPLSHHINIVIWGFFVFSDLCLVSRDSIFEIIILAYWIHISLRKGYRRVAMCWLNNWSLFEQRKTECVAFHDLFDFGHTWRVFQFTSKLFTTPWQHDQILYTTRFLVLLVAY